MTRKNSSNVFLTEKSCFLNGISYSVHLNAYTRKKESFFFINHKKAVKGRILILWVLSIFLNLRRNIELSSNFEHKSNKLKMYTVFFDDKIKAPLFQGLVSGPFPRPLIDHSIIKSYQTDSFSDSFWCVLYIK